MAQAGLSVRKIREQAEDYRDGEDRAIVDERQELNESINILSPSVRHGVERRPGLRWNQCPTSVESAHVG